MHEPTIHEHGADRFGMPWLIVNNAITDLCKAHGIDVSTEPWRTILPEIAYQWCQDVDAVWQRCAPAARPPLAAITRTTRALLADESADPAVLRAHLLWIATILEQEEN